MYIFDTPIPAMPPQLPPPPSRPSLFDVERSSSPPTCEDDVPVACEGLELTVYGLDRTTPHSAADHLRRILLCLKEIPGRDSARDALYDAVVVRSADVNQRFDYAYVSLNRERVPQPRADLLQDLRKTLPDSNPTLRVLWRTQSGPDRTRRVLFTFDSRQRAQRTKAGLDKWMTDKGYDHYADYISKPFGPWRVTYDFLDPSHAGALVESPPVVSGEMLDAHRPQFIVPLYSYQVALLPSLTAATGAPRRTSSTAGSGASFATTLTTLSSTVPWSSRETCILLSSPRGRMWLRLSTVTTTWRPTWRTIQSLGTLSAPLSLVSSTALTASAWRSTGQGRETAPLQRPCGSSPSSDGSLNTPATRGSK